MTQKVMHLAVLAAVLAVVNQPGSQAQSQSNSINKGGLFDSAQNSFLNSTSSLSPVQQAFVLGQLRSSLLGGNSTINNALGVNALSDITNGGYYRNYHGLNSAGYNPMQDFGNYGNTGLLPQFYNSGYGGYQPILQPAYGNSGMYFSQPVPGGGSLTFYQNF